MNINKLTELLQGTEILFNIYIKQGILNRICIVSNSANFMSFSNISAILKPSLGKKLGYGYRTVYIWRQFMEKPKANNLVILSGTFQWARSLKWVYIYTYWKNAPRRWRGGGKY
jgi:hypothetical protein